MAKIFTICNNKGGVGKTTTAVNLGAGLQAHGYDVLLIDFDGQCNLTHTLRAPLSEEANTYIAMKESTTPFIHPAVLIPSCSGQGALHILPGASDLSALDVELAQEPDRITRFCKVVEKYREKYDFILIDTPPTMGLLTISAVLAADELIVTLQPEYLAVSGLVSFGSAINTLSGHKGADIPYTVLFTQYDKRKGMHRMTSEQVELSGYSVFNTKIRDNVALGEAPAAGLDIFRYNKNSNGAIDYSQLVQEFINIHKIEHIEH